VPHTLLLADDSVTIQRVIELTFADEDVQVVAVGDGEQAINILDARPPDIVLADIGMPKVDGYEVAQHIKSTPSLAHIPVVLLTGAFEPVDEVRAARVGVDAVLSKPFEPQLVITRVRELLARPRAQQPAAELPPAPPQELPPPPAQNETPVAEVVYTGPVAIVEPIREVEVPEPVAEHFQVASLLEATRVEIAEPVAAPPAATVEDYFDRLDQAFASLAEGTARSEEPAEESAQREEPSAGAPVPVPVAAQFPTLSEAFAALLDAEQSGVPAGQAGWPGSRGMSAALAPDDLIERVTHDVLQRLSDRVVKETVADIVSSVAERMVRDEIDRIKANIRA